MNAPMMTPETGPLSPITVAIISDTHGRLPEAVENELRKAHHIIHAGDIDSSEILSRLQDIAPVTAARGNMDRTDWSRHLGQTVAVEIGGVWVYVLHDLLRLDLDPSAAGFKVVISGHTHRPLAREENGVLYINPGSCVQPRNGFKPSIALLKISGPEITYRFIEFDSEATG